MQQVSTPIQVADFIRGPASLPQQRAKDATEEQRLSLIQNEGQKLFDSARVAAAASDWPNARLELTKALTIFRRESKLDALKKPTEELLGQVEQELKQAEQKQQTEAKQRAALMQFQKLGGVSCLRGSVLKNEQDHVLGAELAGMGRVERAAKVLARVDGVGVAAATSASVMWRTRLACAAE